MKLMRRHAMYLAQVGVAVCLTLDPEKDVCREAKIALGAVAQVPIRARMAEQSLVNRKVNRAIARAAGEAASQEATPRTSIRASKEYRIAMVEVLVARAVMAAYERIHNDTTVSRKEMAS